MRLINNYPMIQLRRALIVTMSDTTPSITSGNAILISNAKLDISSFVVRHLCHILEVVQDYLVRFSCSVLGGNSLEVVFHFVGSDTPSRGWMVVISGIL